LKRIIGQIRVWLLCAGRLLFLPLGITALVVISGFLRVHPSDLRLLQISMMAVAAPPATLITQFAVMFDKDAFLAGSCNIISMVLCVLTMPLVMAVFTMAVR
jgi:predicted permease